MRSIPLSYGRGMTRYAIDTEGVSRERLALAHDPAELHECASLVAAATAGALSALGVEAPAVAAATSDAHSCSSAGSCASASRSRDTPSVSME